MKRDAYDLVTSTTSSEAQHAFKSAVFGLATHRPSTGSALQSALAADPDHVAVHALRGFANLILARSELGLVATTALGDARASLARNGGGTSDERILVKALEAASEGSFSRAADVLDHGFEDRPATFLPFKLSHALRLMPGDTAGMLQASTRAVDRLDTSAAAAGFVLGCHAFALEEHARYFEALAAGQQAVALQLDDPWGLHAVSHVFEMRGDTEQGVDWLEGITNVMCGMYATVGILAALRHRDRIGAGQHIDLALYDTQVVWLINAATNHLVSGKVPGRIGSRHPNIAPYQTFATGTGEIAIAVGNDQQFIRFCAAINTSHLAEDGRFRRNRDRVVNVDSLDQLISEVLRADTAENWERRLIAAEIPAGRVASIDQVVSNPHTIAREMVVEMQTQDGQRVRLLGNPLKMSATPVRFTRLPPHVDKDVDQKLEELEGIRPAGQS